MTFRNKRGLVGRLATSLPGLVLVGAGAMLTISGSTALAEELKILDVHGKTRSAVVLQEGGTATVRVELAKSAENIAGISVSLVNSATGQVAQTAATDTDGVAVFNNVADGSFRVALEKQTLEVADVKIHLNNIAQRSSDSNSQKRRDARAMYVAGAGAVAGGIGVAIGASDSGSSGSTSAASLTGEGAGAASADGSSVGGFSGGATGGATTSGIADTPPPVGTIDTGGGTPTDLGFPNNIVGPPNLTPGGGTGDTPPDPGAIQDPPAVSSS